MTEPSDLDDLLARLGQHWENETNNGREEEPLAEVLWEASSEIAYLRRTVRRWHFAATLIAAELCLIHTDKTPERLTNAAFREAIEHE